MRKQITDKVITDFVTALMPDDKSRRITAKIMGIHRKYGIDAATSMRIMMDLAKALEEEGLK
jgi:hypothetical protein